jgi:hypothetical protein
MSEYSFSWQPTLEQLLIDDYAAAPQMVFDPSLADGLFAVKADSGEVYHSADSGNNWKTFWAQKALANCRPDRLI